MKRNGARGARAGRPVTAATLAVVAMLALAGCAKTNSTGSSGGNGADGVRATGDSADVAKMKSEGEAMAATLGAPLPKSKQTVGLISVTEAAPVVARGTAGVKAAAAEMGWDVKVCDSGGVPAKMSSCATSLLNQGVTAMISNVIEPSLITPQLKEAQSKGIPWINMLGQTEVSPYYLAQVVENEKEIAHVQNQFMLSQDPPVKTVAYDDYPPIKAVTVRTDVFRREMADANIEIVDHFITDESDFSKSTAWAQGLTQKFPDLDAIWITQSPDGVPVANVLGAKYPGKKYPERPLLVGLYAGLADMDQMRKGNMDGATEVAAESSGWMAIDQLAEIIGRKAKPSIEPNPADNYGYPVDFMEPFLVTPDMVPSDPKQYAPSPHDYVAFFTAKWAKEFTG